MANSTLAGSINAAADHLLPVDLDEQHPGIEQGNEDRQVRTSHQPVEAARSQGNHGDARHHQRSLGYLTKRHTQHVGLTKIGTHRCPVPDPQQMNSQDPHKRGDTQAEHLSPDYHRALPGHE